MKGQEAERNPVRPAPLTCHLSLDCGDAREAEVLASALRVDDPHLAQVLASGAHVKVHLQATSALGLLRAVDDVLECFRAARPDGSEPKESR